jgi:glycosyltransferase involved in cell wall biosynthesis
MSSLKSLYFLMTGGNHWIGGVQYTRNLLRAIDLLPANEKPKVVLALGRKNLNCGYEEEFSRYRFVQVEEAPTWVDRCGKGVRRLLGAQAAKVFIRLLDFVRTRCAAECTVAFPVKGPALPMDIESVLWIPDFQYKCLPEYFQPEDRVQRDKLYAEMLADDSTLVLSSEAVRADFLKYFPEHAHKRVRILRFLSLLTDEDYGPDPVKICSRYGLPEKFVYLPNQFFRHKRHDLVFAALAKLKAQGMTINLVCTGNHQDYRSPEYYESLQTFLKHEGLEGQVSLLGLIPRIDQLQIFRRAAFLLQPSMFEGWSTTVEDGIALGKDVLLSDIATHVEQAPEHGSYFKSGDVDSLARTLAQLWSISSPGPDPTRERQARKTNNERGLAIARNFMDIMKEAHAMYLVRQGQAEPDDAALQLKASEFRGRL